MIFICENNRYATATPFRKIAANTEVASRALVFKVNSATVDGNDVMEVYEAVAEARERAVRGDGPTLIEARTYRHYGHYIGDLLHGVYRTKEEMETFKAAKDPVHNFRTCLLCAYGIAEEQIAEVEQNVREEIAAAVQYAEKSPLPDPASVSDNLFAKESF